MATAKFDNLQAYHPMFRDIIPFLRVGPKYRPRIIESNDNVCDIPSIEDVVNAIIGWWEEFLCKVLGRAKHKRLFVTTDAQANVEDTIKDCVSRYTETLRESFRRKLGELSPSTPAFHPNTLVVDENISRGIRTLKSHFYFTSVDKLSTAFAVVCRVKAAQDILNDLHSNNIYRPVPLSVEELALRLQQECYTRFRICPCTLNSIIPQYVGTWKFRKRIRVNSGLFARPIGHP